MLEKQYHAILDTSGIIQTSYTYDLFKHRRHIVGYTTPYSKKRLPGAYIISFTRCYVLFLALQHSHLNYFPFCSDFVVVLTTAAQRCPHWQCRPLRRALHLKPGTTIFTQNVPSILPRHVPISYALTVLFVPLTSAAFMLYAA
jgi:hypothetical protein